MTEECITWINTFFGDCVNDSLSKTSFWIMMSAYVFWTFGRIPQIILSFSRDNAEALSIVFLVFWTLGDITVTLSMITLEQYGTSLYNGLFFLTMDFLLLVQFCFCWGRSYIKKKKMNSLKNGTNDAFCINYDGVHSPLMSPIRYGSTSQVKTPDSTSGYFYRRTPNESFDSSEHFGTPYDRTRLSYQERECLKTPITYNTSDSSFDQDTPNKPLSLHSDFGSLLSDEDMLHGYDTPSEEDASITFTPSTHKNTEGIVVRRDNVVRKLNFDSLPSGDDIIGQSYQMKDAHRSNSGGKRNLRVVGLTVIIVLLFCLSTIFFNQFSVLSEFQSHKVQGRKLLGSATYTFWPLDSPRKVIGYCLAFISLIFYMSSRPFQIRRNWIRKNTNGLSSLMFICTICGNAAATLSLLVLAWTSWIIMGKLPYIICYVGTVVFDLFILTQIWRYSKRGRIDLKKNDVEIEILKEEFSADP